VRLRLFSKFDSLEFQIASHLSTAISAFHHPPTPPPPAPCCLLLSTSKDADCFFFP
jgi:hypothetical protein